VNSLAVLYVLRQPGPRRAGVTVPRRFGNAVARNRIRRLLWEAYRHCQFGLEDNLWLVLIPRQQAKGARYAEILEALRNLFRRARLTLPGPGERSGGGCVSSAWE